LTSPAALTLWLTDRYFVSLASTVFGEIQEIQAGNWDDQIDQIGGPDGGPSTHGRKEEIAATQDRATPATQDEEEGEDVEMR
jgi:hypothetical protein